MKRCAIVGIAASLLILSGCEEKTFDQRLVDIAVKQGEHEDNINRLASRVEGIDRRLEEIQQSLEKIAPASGSPQPAEASEATASQPQVVEFKETPEYKQIATQLASIQQRLNATQSSLAKTQADAGEQQRRAQLRDPRQAMRAISNPQELNERLDNLLQKFGQKIEDPVKRQQFEADMNQFKRNLSQNPSTNELYQQVVGGLTERLNNEQNDRSREWIQREIKSLESASDEELAGRLERYQRMQTMRQVRDLSSKYNIPRETLMDSGLPAMGRDSRSPRGGRGGRGGGRGR